MHIIAIAPATAWSLVVFDTLCVAVVCSFLIAVTLPIQGQNVKKHFWFWSANFLVYALFLGTIVQSGYLQSMFLPLGPLFMSLTVLLPILLGFSRKGGRMAEALPTFVLVGFQSFRLPLEIVLHAWYRSRTIPQSMTWEGSNWDILTGVLAIVCLPFVGKRLWVAWIFNTIGILLLFNVVRVAVMSSPVPFGWKVEPPLELIVQLPYAFIAPICVGGAFLGHVLLTRKLWKQR